MNKRGFTLIELIGVILILSILGVVTIPIIAGILGNNAEALDKNQEKMIISAAKSYAMKNVFKVSDTQVNCVEVSKLKEEGYLDALNIETHSNNTKNFNNYKVNIKKKEAKYEYTLDSGNCLGSDNKL